MRFGYCTCWMLGLEADADNANLQVVVSTLDPSSKRDDNG